MCGWLKLFFCEEQIRGTRDAYSLERGKGKGEKEERKGQDRERDEDGRG